MDAPKCRTCGERHWSRVCAEPMGGINREPSPLWPVTKPVTSVTKSVTKPPEVTKPVTRCSNCEALETEVAHLKRQLAERPPLKVPTTSTERMRKLRSKGKYDARHEGEPER